MIRVIAPSRLHFGLFTLPTPGVSHWPGPQGKTALPVRQFGGVGLMIDQPGVEVTARPAAEWSASGPATERALVFGHRFVANLPHRASGQAYAIQVHRCAPEHVGLGTGTQLAMAVARALALAAHFDAWNAVELGQRVGRGLRSSLGIHGFERGGLLIEGGKVETTAVAPLLVHSALPDDWRVLVIVPRGQQGAHGTAELKAFQQLTHGEPNMRRTETLCRLALLGMLPALKEDDVAAFGDALYEFNRTVGEMFASWQGGCYANPLVADRVAWLRQHGIRGAGQSSWGPTVFGVERAETLERIRPQLLDHELGRNCDVTVCRAATGARQVF